MGLVVAAGASETESIAPGRLARTVPKPMGIRRSGSYPFRMAR
jgi:hypothetical protein